MSLFRAPGPNDADMRGFLAEVRKAQGTLDAAIAEAQALPDTTLGKTARIKRYNALKREVNRSVSLLQRQTNVWANSAVPRYYSQGFTMAGLQLDAGYEFGLVHQEAVGKLVEDSYGDVATGLQQIKNKFTDRIDALKTMEQLTTTKQAVIRAKGKSVITQQLLTGLLDPKDAAQALRDELWDEGVTIIDRAGRNWNMETYTRMLVRTKSAEAYNSGSLGKYMEEGVSRVQVFDGVIDDAECANANGQIWSIKYAQNHMISHPNCRRAFAPIQGKGTVNKMEQTEMVGVGVEVAIRVQQVLAIQRALKTWRMNPGVVDIHQTFITRQVQNFEAEWFDTEYIAAGIDQMERYLEDVLDPVAVRLGLLGAEDVPSRVPDDWDYLLKKISRSLDEDVEILEATKAKAGELQLLPTERPDFISPPRVSEYFSQDEMAKVEIRLMDWVEGAVDVDEAPGFNVAFHKALRDSLEDIGDDAEAVARLNQVLRHPHKPGTLGDYLEEIGYTEAKYQADFYDGVWEWLDGIIEFKYKNGEEAGAIFVRGERAIEGYEVARLFRTQDWVSFRAAVGPERWDVSGLNALLGLGGAKGIVDDVVFKSWADIIFEGIPWSSEKGPINRWQASSTLEALFGEDRVIKQAFPGTEVGANGMIMGVVDDLGNTFLLKPSAGRVVRPIDALISETLSEAVGRELGLPSLPHVFVPMDAGDLNAVLDIMPLIPDAKKWVDVSANWRASQSVNWVRRHAVADIISEQIDGHGGNYMIRLIDPDAGYIPSNIAMYSIDNEGAWRLTDIRLGNLGDESVNDIMKMSNTVPNQMIQEHLRQWINGKLVDDLGAFTGRADTPRLFLTDDELVQLFGESGLKNIRAKDYADTYPGLLGTSTDVRSITSYRHVDDGWILAPGQQAPGAGGQRAMQPVFYLTETEANVVDDLIGRTADYTLSGAVEEQLENFDPFWFRDQVDIGGYTGDPQDLVDTVLQMTSARVRTLVDEGIFIREPVSSFQDFGTGLGKGVTVNVGEFASFTDVQGRRVAGTVWRIWEDSEGDRIVEVLDGFRDASRPGAAPRFIRLREDEVLKTFGQDFLETTINPAIVDQLAPRAPYAKPLGTPHEYIEDVRKVRKPVVNDVGVFEGFEDAVMQIDDTYVNGVMLGKGAVYPGDLVEKAKTVLAAELGQVAPEYRPRVVRFHSDPIVLPNGQRAHGVFDPVTREMDISLTRAMEDINYEDLNLHVDVEDLDWDRVRRVIRHELGHSVDRGVRDRMEIELGQRVLRDILEDLSLIDDVTGEYITWAQLDARLAPLVRGEVPQGEMAIKTLIEERVAYVMDAVDDMREREVRRFFEDTVLTPDWARYPEDIINGRRKGDFVAEFIAEAWAEGGTVIPPTALPERTYWGLFDDERVAAALNKDLDLPGVFEVWSRATVRDTAPELLLPAEIGFSPSRLIDRVFELPSSEGGGGFTLDVVTGERPTSGWAVALKQRELPIEADELAELGTEGIEKAMDDFARKNADLLSQEGWYMGVWWDEDDTGSLFLDVARVIDDDVQAAAFGIENAQLAMFDLATFHTHDLKRFTTVDEYVIDRGHIPALTGRQVRKGDPESKAVVIRRDGPTEKEIKSLLRKASSKKGLTDAEEEELVDLLRNIRPSGKADHAAMSLRDIPEDTAKRLLEIFEKDYFYTAEGYVTTKAGKKKFIVTKVGDPIDSSLEATTARLERVLMQAQEIMQSDEVIITNDWDFPGGKKLKTPLVLTGEEFRDRLRFYEQWNAGYLAVEAELAAEGLTMELPRIVAAAAAMSPGLLAQANYVGAIEMARLTARNQPISAKLARAIRAYIDEAIASAITHDNPERVIEYTAMRRKVKAGVRFNKLPDLAAVFATRAVVAADPEHPLNLASYLGWQHLIKSRRILMDQSAPVIEVIDNNLKGSKVRSFYNNILDPEDVLGYRDITIDFQMAEAGLGVQGANRTMVTWSKPGLYGVDLGFRTVLAEAVNILYDRGWGGPDSPVGAASLAELQEVIWGVWKHIKGEELWGPLQQLILKP